MSEVFFPLGASYYPPHHDPAEWARDVANMAAAGMTCIRSAELLASWDYIEKVRGQPDWGWLDALFAAAQEHGLRILLGTGSPNPPIWLLDIYPDAQIVDREGHPFPTGTVWGWACRNHPGYRTEVERYLKLLLTRYREHPALWAWQIDNEPGYPFITRRGEEHPRLYDYHPHTGAAFRTWLQAKYRDLDALNVAWRWDCIHHQYSDWAQIQPPRSMPQEWGVVAAWLDWRTFLYENMADFVGWQHAIIKAHDRRHPTMTNIFALSGREVEIGLDPWLMAAKTDAIGYDLYPGIRREMGGGPHFLAAPEYISMFLDMGRSTALHTGVEFWLPELESGPINGWALGPDYTTKPADIIRYNLEALGHGAKAILYQGYREWPCIPIHWGALADFRGRTTARYDAAAKVNRMIAAYAELFRAASPPRAEVAIYDNTRNTTLLHSMAADDLRKRCQRGAYATFWRAGHPVDFIDSGALNRLYGGSSVSADVDHPPADTEEPLYKVILLSCAMLLDEHTGAALRRFVERGGTLIGFAKCAWVDGRGWSWADQPGAGLADLFGVEAGEIERIENVELKIENDGIAPFLNSQSPRGHPILNYPGYWHRQPLTPHNDAEVLARFADGSAALVRHRVGHGQTFYVGTHLDAAAIEHESAAQLLLALVEKTGLRPALRVETQAATVDTHLLLADARRLVIVTNNGDQPAHVRFHLSGFAFSHAKEILHGGALTVADDRSSVAIELEAWGGGVVLLE